MWDAATGRELATLRGHSGDVRSASFSPDGTRIVTGSADGTAITWDTDSYAIRFEERRALLGARSATQPLVDSLWRALQDPKAVARRLREDPALSQTQRRAALDLLLIECSRANDPELQSFSREAEAPISGTSDTRSTTQPSTPAASQPSRQSAPEPAPQPAEAQEASTS